MKNKVLILYPLKNEAWGGGNNFLYFLRDQFIRKKVYTKSLIRASAVIINSHQITKKEVMILFFWKLLNPKKVIIHRLDGPISFHRPYSNTDVFISRVNKLISDGNIFQTSWSKNKNFALVGISPNIQNTVIHNEANFEIFSHSRIRVVAKKIRLVTSSWSMAEKKGFKTYKFIDDNLDFQKYEYYFIGNSPLKFKNIKMLGVMGKFELSSFLKDCDFFISASEDEPCSNSLIEASQCGLSILTHNSGGSPELVKDGDFIFSSKEELLQILQNHDHMRMSRLEKQKIPIVKRQDASNQYIKFISKVLNDKKGRSFIGLYINIFCRLIRHYFNKSEKFKEC